MEGKVLHKYERTVSGILVCCATGSIPRKSNPAFESALWSLKTIDLGIASWQNLGFLTDGKAALFRGLSFQAHLPSMSSQGCVGRRGGPEYKT